MRTRTILLARASLIAVLVSVLGSCTPAVIDRTLPERPVFVELPASGIATPAQRASYQNNPVAVARFERRCTYKPAPNTVCNSSVELKIMVIEGSKNVKAGGHPLGPHLLAIIENRGTTPTFDGILPGEQALVAVGKGPETATMFVRFQPMVGSGNFSVVSREYGLVKDCHRGYSARSSDMSFRGCDTSHWATGARESRPAVLATSLVTVEEQRSFPAGNRATRQLTNVYSLDDPLWLRCSPGCCTS